MPSKSSLLEKRKRNKSASIGDAEEISKVSPTTKDGNTVDPGERSKSMSPRRSSWREKIKNLKGWRDEVKDRKKTKELSQSQRRVIGDRVNKTSSRLSKTRKFQRYERLQSRHGFKTRLQKNISGKQDKKRKKDEKEEGVRCTVSNNEEAAPGSLKVNEDKANSDTSKMVDLVNYDEKGPNIEQGVQQVSLESIQSDEDKLKIEPSAPEMKIGNSKQMDDCNGVINEKHMNSVIDEIEPASDQTQDGCCLMAKQKRDSIETSSSYAGIAPDSGVMARNFSLLELKMEVFTTRLKELEWEREQLRIERAALQVGYPELAAKRICDHKEKE